MSDQEIPVKEQEQPVPEEGAISTEERPPEEYPQQATPPPEYERVWPTTPPPFIPYAQDPEDNTVTDKEVGVVYSRA